jgi:hypothetical protein
MVLSKDFLQFNNDTIHVCIYTLMDSWWCYYTVHRVGMYLSARKKERVALLTWHACFASWYILLYFTYIHTFNIHTYIHAYIHTCMHTYIHTIKYKYIHTYIHTYKHTKILEDIETSVFKTSCSFVWKRFSCSMFPWRWSKSSTWARWARAPWRSWQHSSQLCSLEK